jgi:hemolysin activation/secretion protein
VFSDAELATIAAPYLNRELTSEDFEALRLALTQAYVNRGYISSGAIIPDQTVTSGVVTYHIVEGTLTAIEVEGNRWFTSSYLRNRVALGARPPLNIVVLQQRLQLLRQDERLGRLNAELLPGLAAGESVLKMRVAEVSPYHAWLEVNNHQSPSVGAERGLATVAHQNVTGHGDIMTLRYGRSAGVNPLLDARYALPVTARDTTLILQYRKNDFDVIEQPFKALEIKSESDAYGITIRHPVYRTPNVEVALALTGERLFSKTFLFGEAFAFSPGALNGESRVSAVRFAQEWVFRAPNQVLAAQSRFSLGVDTLDATISDDPALPDGQFFSWLGQFQWARRLGQDSQMIGRVDVQTASDRLFPLEQMALGGRFSVRGYRENTLVRDNGAIASLEYRHSLLRSALREPIVQVAPFVDAGTAWNTREPTPSPRILASVGLGLLWDIVRGSRFEVYWGRQLNRVPTESGNLQSYGVHVQLVASVL